MVSIDRSYNPLPFRNFYNFFLKNPGPLNSIKRFSAVKQLKLGQILFMWRPLQKTCVPITSKNSASVCTQESAGSWLKRNPARKTNANGISIFNNLNHGFGNSLWGSLYLLPIQYIPLHPSFLPLPFPARSLSFFFLYTFLNICLPFSSLKSFFLQNLQAFFPFSLLKLSFPGTFLKLFLPFLFPQLSFPGTFLKLFLPLSVSSTFPFPAHSSNFSAFLFPQLSFPGTFIKLFLPFCSLNLSFPSTFPTLSFPSLYSTFHFPANSSSFSCLSLPTYKVVVYIPAERAGTLTIFLF